MVSSGTPSPLRPRSKTHDLSEIFRASHGSRYEDQAAVASGSSSSLASLSSPGEKSSVSKPRRSMLPFLGRRKPVEQTSSSSAVPPPPSRKSHGASRTPVNPVNTVRRSFGNGHAVLMITPSSIPSRAVPEPPLPSKLPSLDSPTASLGSKLAAHFTPLRTPSKITKARSSLVRKSAAAPTSPLAASPATLVPPVPDIRAPSVESMNPSLQSRSTTPRPLRTVQASPVKDGDDEDFSDLFTLPNQTPAAEQCLKSASTLSVNTFHCKSSSKDSDVSPKLVDAIFPGPCLQFPVPPTTIGRRPSKLSENDSFRSSADLVSLSSQYSKSPSKPKALVTPQVLIDSDSSTSVVLNGFPSQGEPYRSRHRTKSLSGSDTDKSRHYDSSYSSTSAKLHLFPKPPNLKSPASGMAKALSGPPPSGPLPTPPLPPPPSVPSVPSGLGFHSVPNTPPTRPPVSPRPRANTLSATSNLTPPGQPIPMTTSLQTGKENVLMPDATADELRDALVLQCRKNSQLQDYIATITKRYEGDRVAMTKTIEKLERNVQKKMREIEGLRWLVIHNGAVSDIDAAANLARSSLSTHEDGMSGPLPSNPSDCRALVQDPPSKDGSSTKPLSTRSIPEGSVISTKASSSTLEVPSDMASSVTSSLTSSSLPALNPYTSSSLSAIPGRVGSISRAERQKSKEERRATRALRRISASSTPIFASSSNPTLPSADVSLDPISDPKQSMEEALEKLRPFA